MKIKGGIQIGGLNIRGVLFSPASLSGLSLWLKADAGVTLSGSNVTSWADQSGNGNNATPLEGLDSPTYQANSINSKPSIYFDFSFLQIPTNSIGNSGNISIFIALDYTGGEVILNKGDGASYAGSEWEISTANGFGYVDISAEQWKYSTYTQGTGLQLLGGIATAGVFQVAINGTNVGTPPDAPSQLNPISQNIGIGGCGQGTLVNANMNVAEIIIYNRAVTSTERQQVESYLNTKYAIY